MQRILAAIQGLADKNKRDRKVSRVKRAIAAAHDNAQDEIERLEDCKASVIMKLCGETDVNCVINELSDLIDKQEEQRAIVTRLGKIADFFKEEVDVDQPSDK